MTTFNHIWLPAPKNLILSADHVHIWKINLNQPESQIQSFRETLSSEEIARAERFYFPEHRQRFIVGRGSLRAILGRYLSVNPSQVEFDYQQRGKPTLAAKFADSRVFFNLSHSQDLGLCGVTYQRLIGVDLEYIRPMSDLESLAKRFFLPKEYEVIKLLSPEQQQQVFFRYWTCKEAYLKATGDGLVQLEQVEIDLTPSESAQLLVSGDWGLKELVPADNFAAAVVVANDDLNFQFWQS
ncbi:4'-phosphopantetheinyl transferase superfamily protein [Anabaena cylindrica FACHB-243]|uniref:4'-phosphopantetheinyl transferase n=1 Tax=Anabaena cylindrica (strain ATCC 27899 / PCC 7122) TaxID=272123 RepID=K9ZN26_ANACC|nr:MULTISPECIES: 4'-phosphopantetheinyl transferase HetI [Anabaena]AFZ59695.1 4'-phosphopantetheinyl transferase [Anabaena cylindrica PCC 7122]MBD2418643.1 4'-phosphopantetheinyl transferase superfamily protein [Anabaena cylindrica FACHB-243]MBY5283386.1 4'-phosphopantetheinyl transferase superfamily protein [Anabaena sp. CCAP 1446/1C]MBY5307759.1 4'-phosphopantetheinyl transferase superfamily protein [Anabaena sp. CCAP 1446/1C]MCM2406205.1 4'-phosphopantetheinyl transferase superfamily protei